MSRAFSDEVLLTIVGSPGILRIVDHGYARSAPLRRRIIRFPTERCWSLPGHQALLDAKKHWEGMSGPFAPTSTPPGRSQSHRLGRPLRDVERMAYVPWVKSGDEPGLVQRSYRHKKETVAIGQAHLIQRPSKHRLAVSQECLRQFRGIGWHLGS